MNSKIPPGGQPTSPGKEGGPFRLPDTVTPPNLPDTTRPLAPAINAAPLHRRPLPPADLPQAATGTPSPGEPPANQTPPNDTAALLPANHSNEPLPSRRAIPARSTPPSDDRDEVTARINTPQEITTNTPTPDDLTTMFQPVTEVKFVLPREPITSRHIAEPLQLADDITFIGTHHSSGPVGIVPPAFINEINDADILIREGTGLETEGTYEANAVREFFRQGKRVMYLERGVDPVQDLIDSGIPRDVALFTNTAEALGHALPLTDESRSAYLDNLIIRLQDHSPVYAAIPPEELRSRLDTWSANIRQAIEQGVDLSGADLLLLFESARREARMFSPEAVEHMRRLPGKKLILMGLGHEPIAEDAFRGDPPPSEPTWQEFLEGLDEDEQLALDRITAVISHQQPDEATREQIEKPTKRSRSPRKRSEPPPSEPTSLSAAYQPERRGFPPPTSPSKIKFWEIPEELKPHLEHNAPSVIRVGENISVIGTDHWSIPPGNMTPPENFTNAIAHAKHIILEGHPFVYEGTYEAIAVTAAESKKSIRFLEAESGDPVRVLETLGMPPRVAAFFKMHRNLLLGFSEIYNNKSRSYQDSLTDAIAWLIPTSREISPYFSEKTDEQLTNLFSGWIRGIERHLSQGGDLEGFDIAEGYEAKIRESRMFSAENMAALQRLPGNKTIIVGKSHTPAVIQALNGRYPQEPSRWRNYVKDLSQEEKDAVGDLYDLAYSSRRT